MMISTKGRYALRVMLDLAQQPAGEYISLKSISQRQAVSMKYMEAIAVKLEYHEAVVSTVHKAGMVESLRGKKGGYRLTRSADKYTIGEILKLTEGSLAPVTCLECENPCQRAESCITRPMWLELNKLIDDYLESKTLADLLGEDKKDED